MPRNPGIIQSKRKKTVRTGKKRNSTLPRPVVKKLESVKRRQRKIFFARFFITAALILLFGFSIAVRLFDLL